MSNFRPVSFLGCSLALVAACSSSPDTQGKPTGAADKAAASSVLPPATSAQPLYTFHGVASASTGTLVVTYRAVTPQGPVIDDAIPEGPNGIVVHTMPGTVIFDTSNTAGCGGTVGDPHLCGNVALINHLPDTVTDLAVSFSSFTASGVTAVGAPYAYGDVAGSGAQSKAIEWVLDDPTASDFSFDGVVTGTSNASPCGVCSEPTPFCLPGPNTCVECLHDADCVPKGYDFCLANQCF